jgi:hypothetical protein
MVAEDVKVCCLSGLKWPEAVPLISGFFSMMGFIKTKIGIRK